MLFSFFCRESGVASPIYLVSRVWTPVINLLITRTVAARVITTAPECLSLFGAFLYHALEHWFATFGAVRSISRLCLLLPMLYSGLCKALGKTTFLRKFLKQLVNYSR